MTRSFNWHETILHAPVGHVTADTHFIGLEALTFQNGAYKMADGPVFFLSVCIAT